MKVTIYIYIYIECDKSCKGCTGGTELDCLSCNSSYTEYHLGTKSKLNCIICEDIRGMRTIIDISNTKQSICEEICGDGINLGQYECDDGNLENGDGCDNKCKIEDGFECYIPNITIFNDSLYLSSLCRDNEAPVPRLELFDHNILRAYIHMSEPVRSKYLKDPKKCVVVDIKGFYSQYIYDYKVYSANFTSEKKSNYSEFLNITYSIFLLEIIPQSTIVQDDVNYIYIYIYNYI